MQEELPALQQLLVGPVLAAIGLVALWTRQEIRDRLSRTFAMRRPLPSGGALGFLLFTFAPSVFVLVGALVFLRGLLRVL